MTVVSMADHPARLLQAALQCAAEGWPVFPVWGIRHGQCACKKGALCGQPGKHPIYSGSFKAASTEPSIIRGWWRANPEANIGLAIGAVDMVVVDVDPRNGGDRTLNQLEQEFGDLPPTHTVNTGGGGLHYYYKLPEGEKFSCAIAGQGIELKTRGGYVVAPPSMHFSGKRYEVELAAVDTVSDAPRWVLDYLRKELREPTRGASGVDPIQSIMGAAFTAAGMTARNLGDDRVAVECPWNHEHTGGEIGDSSTVLFSPTKKGGAGWFHCSHAHCAERKQLEVWETLPENARSAALKRFKASPDWAPSEDGTGALPLPQDAPSMIERDLRAQAPEVASTEVPDPEEVASTEFPAAPKSDWKKLLRFDGKGRLTKDPGNVALVLQNYEEWSGCLSMNQLKGELRWNRVPPNGQHFGIEEPRAWRDGDYIAIAHWFAREQHVTLGRDMVEHAARVIGENASTDPVGEYLRSLRWDGVDRLSSWLVAYMGSPATDWSRLVGRKWLISAVARGLHPGCKVDTTLIFESGQGTGKSTALRLLARNAEWFLDSMPPIGDKDSKLATLGHWIIEFGELEAFKGVSLQKLKSWLTEQYDTLRVPYARTMITRPRRCVFAGSTNEVGYLHDPTGARRFWPVEVGVSDLDGIARDADQLWAQARHALEFGGTGNNYYPRGEAWHLTTQEQALASIEQGARTTRDPWADTLIAQIVVRGVLWCSVESALDMLQVPRGNWTPATGQRVGSIMHAHGWVRELVTVDGHTAQYWIDPDNRARAVEQIKASKRPTCQGGPGR